MAELKGVVELKVKSKVKTPDGNGVVTSISDDTVYVDLANGQKAKYRPRYVELA